jgi:tetratricopeptide (TPR) repeat protein
MIARMKPATDARCNRQHTAAVLSLVRLVAAVAIGVLLLTSAARADIEERLRAGREALAAKDFEAALESLQQGLQEAQRGSSEKTTGTFQFLIALTLQERFDAFGPGAPSTWLNQAFDHYRLASSNLGKSAGIWNNFAEVAAKLDRPDVATDAYRQAIDLGGERQTMYMINYADFLAGREDWRGAKELYGAVLDQHPTSKRAFEGLMKAETNSNPKKLANLSWSLFRKGLVALALETAFEALERSDRLELDSETRESLLKCVVVCLSEQSYPPAGFEKTGTAERMRAAGSSAALSEAIDQVLRLHVPDELQRKNFSWWRERVAPRFARSAPSGGWAHEAFTALARSLGDRYRQENDLEAAKRYYEFAYGLSESQLDALAILKLADMWVSVGRVDELRSFFEREENRLFSEKSEAISAGNDRRAYELHRALARIYSHIGPWADGHPYKNLERQTVLALAAAKRFNEAARETKVEDRLFDHRLTSTLAGWYEANGRARDGFRLRVEQTQYLLEIDAPEEAAKLFAPISQQSLPPGLSGEHHKSFERLKGAFRSSGFGPVGGSATGLGRPLRFTTNLQGRDAEIVVPASARLDPAQNAEVQRAIEFYIRDFAKEGPPTGSFRLAPKDAPRNVSGFELDGLRGKVTVDQGEGRVVVPFEIRSDWKPISKSIRYVGG